MNLTGKCMLLLPCDSLNVYEEITGLNISDLDITFLKKIFRHNLLCNIIFLSEQNHYEKDNKINRRTDLSVMRHRNRNKYLK